MKKYPKWLFVCIFLFSFLLVISLFQAEPKAAQLSPRTFHPVEIHTVYDTSVFVLGNAAPNSIVTIQTSYRSYRARTSNTGYYGITLDQKERVNAKITVACDSVWYRTSTTYVKKDLNPLKKPYIQPVTNEDLVVRGRAGNASHVQFKIDGDFYWGFPNKDGDFTIQLNKKYRVGSNIEVAGQNETRMTTFEQSKVIKKETLVAPTLSVITDKDTTIDGIAPDAEVVYVTIEGAVYQALPNASTGAFHIRLNRTYPAGTIVEAYSQSGSTSSSKTTVKVIPSQAKIKQPTIQPVSSSDRVVTGTADANVKIIAQIGVDNYEGYSNGMGEYTIRLDKTYPAGTYISVYAVKGSDRSETAYASVVQGEFLLGVNMATDKDREISGRAVANATVTVKIKDRLYQGKANSSGLFAIPIESIYSAGQNILVTAIDPVSKRSEQKTVQLYPSRPSINTVRAGADSVSGIASPNAYVIVQIGGKEYGAYASASGYYFIAINPNDAVRGAQITVSQIVNGIESIANEIEILN